MALVTSPQLFYDLDLLGADGIFTKILVEMAGQDSRLWDDWGWTELAPEVTAAIAYFSRPPEVKYYWNEDDLVTA